MEHHLSIIHERFNHRPPSLPIARPLPSRWLRERQSAIAGAGFAMEGPSEGPTLGILMDALGAPGQG